MRHKPIASLTRHELPRGSQRAVQEVNFIGNSFAQTMPSAGATAGVAYTVAALRLRGVDTGLSLWSSTLAALVSAVVLVVIGPLMLAYDGLLALPTAAVLSGVLAAAICGVWLLLRRRKSLRWIARRIVAFARHLPWFKDSSWVTGHPSPADAISEIHRIREAAAAEAGL